MSFRFVGIVSAGLLLLAGCKGPTNVSHNPAHLKLVSGSNQTGGLSSVLPAPLVVRATDGAGRPVVGVPITWAVTGGGSISSGDSTNALGEDTATWTLGPTPGSQTATATSPDIRRASVSFTASNGATIAGTASVANLDPASFFTAPDTLASTAGFARTPFRTQRSSSKIVVMYRSGVFGVAAAGAPVYRSMQVARSTAALLHRWTDTLVHGFPVARVRISPVILAAQITLSDTMKTHSLLAALRADPAVASASREAIYSVPDGAPPPQAAGARFSALGLPRAAGAATRLPDDPYVPYQSWGLNMTDLPRAWAITTGGTGFTIAVVDMGVRFDDPVVAPDFTTDGYDFVSNDSLSVFGYSSSDQICGGGTLATIDDDGTPGPDPDPTDPGDFTYDSAGACWRPQSLGDHGLWVSGIIGALGNDGLGTTGVDWTARIRPIRALGVTGDGLSFDIAQGILYAAGLPATGAGDSLVVAPSRSPIINLSLAGPASDPATSQAVAAAIQAGCLVVAAAGNISSTAPEYPAGYPGVLAVSAVGMNGTIASYSNIGSDIGLAAPGGEFRGDPNGGGGVLGPGWDFVTNQPTFLFGYGTSAAAPYVSGIAGLLLANDPSLSAAELTSRLEQWATRAPGSGRNDTYGYGIVNAYNALTQQDGPPRATYVRLLDAASGSIVGMVPANAAGAFAFTQLAPGAYQLEAGQDESGDSLIGLPGRRFGWDGTAATPTTFTVTSGTPTVQTTSFSFGVPLELEPDDTPAEANALSVGGYVIGSITAPDFYDYYRVLIPASGTYAFATSGVTGTCGWGLELDTKLDLLSSSGATIASNDDDSSSPAGPYCSLITQTLSPGIYYVRVSAGAGTGGAATQGRYELQVRSAS